MGKLTNADIQELTWWFSSPEAGVISGTVQAQTYEPRGGGGYDPYTDERLANLVGAAVKRHLGEWARVKRGLDHLCERANGRAHFETLRRACGPRPSYALPESEFRWPEVAVVVPAALERGHELAHEAELEHLVEVTYNDARMSGCSSITTAMRVYERERRVLTHGLRIDGGTVRSMARRAIERALRSKDDEAFVTQVKEQMFAMVDVAGEAYRAARADISATKRADKARRRAESEALLDELLGKKRRRESARFEAKLRRAS